MLRSTWLLGWVPLLLTHWGQHTLHSRLTRLNPKWLEVLFPPIKEEIQRRNHRCRFEECPLMNQE